MSHRLLRTKVEIRSPAHGIVGCLTAGIEHGGAQGCGRVRDVERVAWGVEQTVVDGAAEVGGAEVVDGPERGDHVPVAGELERGADAEAVVEVLGGAVGRAGGDVGEGGVGRMFSPAIFRAVSEPS
jgi:hypothetical protein